MFGPIGICFGCWLGVILFLFINRPYLAPYGFLYNLYLQLLFSLLFLATWLKLAPMMRPPLFSIWLVLLPGTIFQTVLQKPQLFLRIMHPYLAKCISPG